MEYLKIRFTSGISGEGYQEISEGYVQRLTDLDGNTVGEDAPCEYHVTDGSPSFPEWGSHA